ncbi:MAG: M61 family peptidase [Betaproteobacteria bacterium]|nr:M61 family peptidase [Betaproteobacteria bacterium]
MTPPPIRYTIIPKHPEAHLFEVTCVVVDPDPAGQRFTLPAWIPGSYLIREFARNVTSIRATSRGKSLRITKLDKQTWQCAPTTTPVTVVMEVYGHDLSVRGAHLDTTHAFFNGTSVFLRVLGQEHLPCEVDIRPARGARYRRWQVATAMRRGYAKPYGFGTYVAKDYDELTDHPVEIGTFTLARFKAAVVPHDIAITGRHGADLARLCKDLKRLCEWHIEFFGRPAPMDRYVFLVTALGEGYAGLEHRASTALLCSRDDLPQAGTKEITDGYRGFLGLCSHEYFHTWNVKRIKPAAFVPYDLERENYTSLLWAMEGITSYYDDLALVRCGLISHAAYTELLGRAITNHLRTLGRLKQTVADASWDAWIKYYRQDENSPNALVSYYLKGSLVALCLDLLIREQTKGRKSLDDVMRALWERHGRTGAGIPEDGIERLAEELSGLRLKGFFDRALRSTGELPLKTALAYAGIELHVRASTGATDKGGMAGTDTKPRAVLGARTTEDAAGVKLTHVLDGGAAQRAGLSAGDVIVAIDGLRVNAKNLDQRLSTHPMGGSAALHYFRRDELCSATLPVLAAPLDTSYLIIAKSPPSVAKRRAAWLGSLEGT